MPGQSLIAYYENNIQGICTAVTGRALGKGRMLVCWQPDDQTSAVVQEIYYDRNKRCSEAKTLKTYDDFDAGDPAAVQQLFADAAELAPARNYGLIIGCHGKAWIPASGGVLPRSMLPADVRRAVDYIVASPCEIMAAGFPYDRIVPHLFEGNGVFDGLEKACWEFWNFYENDWDTVQRNEQSGCISLAVTAQLDALMMEMRQIKDKKQPFDIDALQYYKGNATKLFYDLEHYVTLCCNDQGAIDSFKAQMELAFPVSCRHHTKYFYSAYDAIKHPVNYYSGVSVSEPSTVYAAENRQTNWYRDTH